MQGNLRLLRAVTQVCVDFIHEIVRFCLFQNDEEDARCDTVIFDPAAKVTTGFIVQYDIGGSFPQRDINRAKPKDRPRSDVIGAKNGGLSFWCLKRTAAYRSFRVISINPNS
jgi:hypothetical protein